jgi:hypothetical protein
MMNTDGNTPISGAGKNGKAEPRAKKAAKRSRKPAEQAAPEPAEQAAPTPEPAEQPPEPAEQPREPIPVAAVAMENPSFEAAPTEAATTEAAPTEAAPAEAAPAEAALAEVAPAEHLEAAPVSLQAITNAYGDFTRKSIEQTGCFFEQLAGARSLGRVFELQGEFARRSYETFVAESRKIRELHSELTMQRLRDLEGIVARMKPTR